ncbi:hypothetical protein QP920_06910 [Corynebacterium marquesiae]|nr:hypothetical protein [Corynebacterium marquesiae]MDK8496173.1 hypothetical protein [Corynebacterium marquesiae]MDU5016760.1 hypothetical protein [Corynebacterium sp.]MDU7101681.1 hypothetical protein [Corynebacterium sp.]
MHYLEVAHIRLLMLDFLPLLELTMWDPFTNESLKLTLALHGLR